MPELSIIYYRWCKTNEYWRKSVTGNKGTTYYVEFKRRFTGDVQYDYTCTCPAYKFHPEKYCKHIETVKHEHCQWNHEAGYGCSEDFTGDKCPQCGEDLVSITVGV